MKRRQFILEVKTESRKKIVIKEQILNGKLIQREPLVEIGGFPLSIVEDDLVKLLNNGENKIHYLKEKEYVLSEEEGIRTTLLFSLIKPLKKMERIEKVRLGLESMEIEELYYWYSLSNRDGKKENAKKALRILLSGE